MKIQKKLTKQHAGMLGFKRLVGRLYVPRQDIDAAPVLIIREGAEILPVANILKILAAYPDASHHEIVGIVNYRGVKPSDIETLRVYAHRFGYDPAKKLRLEEHAERAVLLDENSPHPAVLPISSIFGWATHVGFENLCGRDTPDERIWEFAQANEFGSIVTRDTDFLEIHERRANLAIKAGEHTPYLIFIKGNLTTENLAVLFKRHANSIVSNMKTTGQLACEMSDERGYRPIF